MTRDEILDALTRLIAQKDVQNEADCGELLARPEAASVLLPLGAELVLVDTELRNSAGDVDLLISVDELRPGGVVTRVLYVWELKAPQAHLFRMETQRRACPSDELHKAENQLLHYHALVAGSEEDRRRFGVLASQDVRLGGIVIGTSDSFVASSRTVTSEKAHALADRTRNIRERAIYLANGMFLLDWSMVVAKLRAVTASHTTIVGSGSAVVPLSTGPVVDSTGSMLPAVTLSDGG